MRRVSLRAGDAQRAIVVGATDIALATMQAPPPNEERSTSGPNRGGQVDGGRTLIGRWWGFQLDNYPHARSPGQVDGAQIEAY
jgi:hypothetical protein